MKRALETALVIAFVGLSAILWRTWSIRHGYGLPQRQGPAAPPRPDLPEAAPPAALAPRNVIGLPPIRLSRPPRMPREAPVPPPPN